MGKKYLETKGNSLESSILGLWQEAAGTKKDEELSKKQKKLDVDGDGEIEGSDLAKLRKKGAKKEGNSFGKALMAAKEKGDKTFVVAGKTYEVKEEVDLDEGKMNDLSMKVDAVVAKMKKHRDMKGFADKFKKDVTKSMNIGKSLEKVLPDYIAGKDIQKLMGESYEIGTDEYRMHTQSITPGQEITDYQRFKVESMKEALAKVWGLDEQAAKYLEIEFKDKTTAEKAYNHINNKIEPGGNQPWDDFNQEGNSIQFDNMRDADGLMKELKKKFKFKVYEREEVEDKDLTKLSKNGKVATGAEADEINLKPKIKD